MRKPSRSAIRIAGHTKVVDAEQTGSSLSSSELPHHGSESNAASGAGSDYCECTNGLNVQGSFTVWYV